MIYIVTPSFSTSSVSNMFHLHTKTKSRRFQIPSVSRALRKAPHGFLDALVCTVGLTVEIKSRFQILRRGVDRAIQLINVLTSVVSMLRSLLILNFCL